MDYETLAMIKTSAKQSTYSGMGKQTPSSINFDNATTKLVHPPTTVVVLV